MGLFSRDIATFEDPFLHQLQHVHYVGKEITHCGTLIAWANQLGRSELVAMRPTTR